VRFGCSLFDCLDPYCSDVFHGTGVRGWSKPPCKPLRSSWDVREGFERGSVPIPPLQAALALNGDSIEASCPGWRLLGPWPAEAVPLGLSLCNNVNGR
jgi:hypothetical protein